MNTRNFTPITPKKAPVPPSQPVYTAPRSTEQYAQTLKALPPDLYNRVDGIFHSHLPDSLYMSPAELNQLDTGTILNYWKLYLEHPDVQRFIEREIAKEMEILARKSLRKLSSSDLNSNDINAIKEILAKSKIIQEKNQSKETVILTYIPKRKEF